MLTFHSTIQWGKKMQFIQPLDGISFKLLTMPLSFQISQLLLPYSELFYNSLFRKHLTFSPGSPTSPLEPTAPISPQVQNSTALFLSAYVRSFSVSSTYQIILPHLLFHQVSQILLYSQEDPGGKKRRPQGVQNHKIESINISQCKVLLLLKLAWHYSTFGPGIPRAPFCPFRPFSPSFPGIPGKPGTPGGPGSPCRVVEYLLST